MTVVVETERLILRHIDIEKDLKPWTEMMSDEWTVKHIGGQVMDEAASWRQMAMMIGHQHVRGYGFYSTIEKATGQFVGRIGHWGPVGWPEPEIGWAVHPAHTRKGFAKEAGAACIDYAFGKLGWDRVIHVIAEDNIASIKTAEAIGSEKMYPIDNLPPFGDVNCWAYGQTR